MWYLHCGSKSLATVGQLVGTEKTNIITGLSFTGVYKGNWELDGGKLLGYVQFCLKESDASP